MGITRLGGAEYLTEFTASMGSEWENATEVSYSTEYTSDSRDDRVVLSMTPYIRYVYEAYIPEYKMPTKAEYDARLKELADEEDKERYKAEVQEAMDKGFNWGTTVPASATEYIVCMPQTPRMSMVEGQRLR